MVSLTSNIIVEVVVRSIAIVLSIGALIAATVSLAKLQEINTNNVSDITTGIIDTLSPNVRQITAAAVALAIVSGLVVPMEAVMIVLRFFKFKLGIFGKILAIVDLVLIIIAVCGFGVAGVLSAIAAQSWSEDVLGRVPGALPFADIFTRDIEDVRNGIAAAAACTFLACGACVILLFFVIALMYKTKKIDYIGKS